MSARYNITVENQRGTHTNYAAFMGFPDFSGGPQQPWMNVWYTSFVPGGGSFEILTGTDFFAWAGTVPSKPQPGVVLSSAMSQYCRLGDEQNPGSTFELKLEDSFPTLSEVTASAHRGAFQINAGADLPMPNDTYLVGLANINNRGQVVPVATVAPFPRSTIEITPLMKFFVAESQQVAGEIVDHDDIARNGATIDFEQGEGRGKFFAHVVQESDGKFTVTYKDSRC